MDLSEIQENLIGTWTGRNLLRLNPDTSLDFFCPSDLSAAPVAKGKFLSFTYTWNHENVPQEGVLVVGYDNKQNIATAAWVDSWHMSSKVMFCQGVITKHGVIDLRGSYEAPPGPDWGWRIIISAPSATKLQIIMHNCSPDGKEELAVQAEYTRMSKA